MSQTASDTSEPITVVEQITRDLACPVCDYNLRGLSGPMVQCPECGTEVDAARLVTAQWTKPWYKAPGFNTLVWPTVWMTVAMLGVFFGGMIWIKVGQSTMTTPLVLGLFPAVVLGWAGLMWLSARSFGRFEGVLLALLVHALFVGYLLGILLIVVNLMVAVSYIFGSGTTISVYQTGLNIVLVVVGAALIWLCRRGERFVAGRCIRRYLAKYTLGQTS